MDEATKMVRKIQRSTFCEAFDAVVRSTKDQDLQVNKLVDVITKQCCTMQVETGAPTRMVLSSLWAELIDWMEVIPIKENVPVDTLVRVIAALKARDDSVLDHEKSPRAFPHEGKVRFNPWISSRSGSV